MATTAPPTPVGDRPVGAGTTMRFALLVVLILVTSGLMLLYMAYWWVSKADSYRCSLAAGVDPDHATDLQIIVSRSTQSMAYLDCQRHYAQPPPWWVPVSCLVLLSAAAVALFYWLPVWKARRGRAVPLTAVDHDGEIRHVLEEVAAVAGLDRMPRVLVDTTAASVGALVFGRNGRPIMSLHGGLLARRHRDPEGFRAVLLHEFAHIRNGDVTLTYATVALWRVFLTLVTPPFLVGLAMYLVYGVRLGSPVFVGPSRNFLQTAFLVVLVYLARSDVLRSREQRRAAGWAVAGGILLELVLAGRVSVAGKYLKLADRTPTGERLLDDRMALLDAWLRGREKRRVTEWLKRERRKAGDAAVESLCARRARRTAAQGPRPVPHAPPPRGRRRAREGVASAAPSRRPGRCHPGRAYGGPHRPDPRRQAAPPGVPRCPA
ncbi:GPP34 family phosphoprotein [Streptomyces noursei]|uniref:GPP34 family phosphoprotein n=1 Tax=Streptomyces noursei TaxID=1971 RepID=UPI0033D87495